MLSKLPSIIYLICRILSSILTMLKTYFSLCQFLPLSNSNFLAEIGEFLNLFSRHPNFSVLRINLGSYTYVLSSYPLNTTNTIIHGQSICLQRILGVILKICYKFGSTGSLRLKGPSCSFGSLKIPHIPYPLDTIDLLNPETVIPAHKQLRPQ